MTEVRDLCGAMGVLRDAEGGCGVESCHIWVRLRRAVRARRGTIWIMLIGHVSRAREIVRPAVELVQLTVKPAK